MPKRPIRKKIENHFHVCDKCGYKGGFHVTFKKTRKLKTFLIVLMCPQCEQTYDIDWHIQLEQ